MKIILTGYTSPIGKVLYEHLSKNHEVIGISRTSDYDLLTTEDIDRVVGESINADHFINLANISTQAEILYKVHTLWSSVGKQGKIISFGTLATEVPHSLLQRIPINMQMLASKLSLEKMHRELSFIQPFGSQPESTLLRFANYGQKLDHRANEPFTSSEQMVSMVEFILNADTYISAIDFREILCH
jgi:hypothetical protein